MFERKYVRHERYYNKYIDRFLCFSYFSDKTHNEKSYGHSTSGATVYTDIKKDIIIIIVEAKDNEMLLSFSVTSIACAPIRLFFIELPGKV